MPVPDTPLRRMSCAALRTMRSRGGCSRGSDALAAVTIGTKVMSALDYDTRHDSYSHYMTSVMMAQAPSARFRDTNDVRILRPTRSDTEAVLEMLRRCSRTSLLHRFHGFTDGVNYFEALLQDGPVDQTFLAWCQSTCVAVATLGARATGVVDLGVLVEDGWQRRGIGAWLVASLLVNARANGVTTVHADVLGDDRFILEALRRIGPLTVAIESGSYSIDIEIGRHRAEGSGTHRPVELTTASGSHNRFGRPPAEIGPALW
jgi:N-acetylglutamate synthase-like GNAT family acetyltransferase